MATNLFADEAAASSSAGENTTGAADMGFRGVDENSKKVGGRNVVYKGSLGRSSYAKLFPLGYDPIQAVMDGSVTFSAGSNRMLDDSVLNFLRERIFSVCEMKSMNDNVTKAFVNAVCLAHAKNSGSVIQPDRVNFSVTVGDEVRVWNYFNSIVNPLGPDYRRFFRHYADYTRDLLLKILSHRGDDNFADDIRDIEWVAADRGLTRYPHLIHDSAEACTLLSHAERLALQSSKRAVLAQYIGGNPVDNPYVVRSEGVAGTSGGFFNGPGASRTNANTMNSPARGELGY